MGCSSNLRGQFELPRILIPLPKRGNSPLCRSSKKSTATGPSKPDYLPDSLAARVKEYDQPEAHSLHCELGVEDAQKKSGRIPRGRSKFQFPKQQRQG